MQHARKRRILTFFPARCRCGLRWPCPDGVFNYFDRMPVPDGAALLARADPRFTTGLVHAIADTMEAHGYPLIADGPDFDHLSAALARFLHGSSRIVRVS